MKLSPASTSERPSITVSPVVLANISDQSILIPVTIDRTVETLALVDTGAGGPFIDENFALKENIKLRPLITPITVFNVDGMKNKQGAISHYTWKNLTVAGVTCPTRLLATSLGKENLILGLPWLRRTKARINWDESKIHFSEPRYTFARINTPRTDPPRSPTIETLPENCSENPLDDPPEQQEGLDSEDLLISYIKGEPVVGVFQESEAPLTDEHLNWTQGLYISVNHLEHWRSNSNLRRFSYGQQ